MPPSSCRRAHPTCGTRRSAPSVHRRRGRLSSVVPFGLLAQGLVRGVLPVIVALVCLVSGAGPAAAHAQLVEAVPADGARLDVLPAQVHLRFDEPIERGATVRVFDGTGARVDRGTVQEPTPGELAVGLRVPTDPAGAYVVSYAVTSADGHPVRGALVWTVGDGSVDDAVVAELFRSGTTTSPVLVGLGTALRVLATTGLLLAVGAVVFLLVVHDGERSERRLLGRVTALAAGVATAALGGGLAVQATVLSGRLDPPTLTAVLDSRLGVATLLKTAGLVLVAAATWRFQTVRRAALAATGASVAVIASPLSGHAAVTSPTTIVAAADLAHVLGGAVWFGGLVCLLIALHRRRAVDDPVGGAQMVARWSTAATVAVAVVGLAGLGLAWSQVRAWRALAGAYGLTLGVKVAVVVVVVAIGVYNHRRLVPAVVRGHGGAWRMLARTVRSEVVGLAVVLMLTAVLTTLVPARIAEGVTGAFTARATLEKGGTLDVTLDPARAGVNELHLYLFGPDGRPLDVEATDVCETGGDDESTPCVTVAFTQVARDIGPLVRRPQVTGPGHWQLTGRELSIPGVWRVDVTARRDIVTEDVTSVEVVVD